jgi:hypothetical protein
MEQRATSKRPSHAVSGELDTTTVVAVGSTLSDFHSLQAFMLPGTELRQQHGSSFTEQRTAGMAWLMFSP